MIGLFSNISANNTRLTYNDGEMYLTMIPNPSHLEVCAVSLSQIERHIFLPPPILIGYILQACDPVAVGKTRAKQRYSEDGAYRTHPSGGNDHRVLCFQIHGDAAFSGQVCLSHTL